jgi:hypothetical protein
MAPTQYGLVAWPDGVERGGPRSHQRDETVRDHLDTLDLEDMEQVKAWALLLKDALDDMAAAGDEATRPRSQRVLSKAEARRQLFESWTKALQLLGALQRGAR